MSDPAPFGVFSSDVPLAPHRRAPLPVKPEGDWTSGDDLEATDKPAPDRRITKGQVLNARREGLGERFLDVGEDSFWRAPLGSLNRWLEGLVPAAEDYDGTPGADNSRAALQERARARVTTRERDRRESYDARSADDSWNRDEGLSAGDVARGMVNVAGMLGGAIAGDPTTFIAPGRTFLGKVGSQTGVAVGADAATQGSEMLEGVRDEYDALQTGAQVAIVPATVAIEQIVKGIARRAKTPAGELADEADAAIPPAEQTQQQRQALAELRRDDEITRDSPFTPGAGSAAHRGKLDEATGALLRGEPPAAAPVRQRPISSAEAAARLEANPREQLKRGIAKAETGGHRDPNNAKNPLSSARGRYQIIDGTWIRTMRALGETGSDAGLLMKRGNVVWQERVMDRLLVDYGSALARVGAPETPGNLYLMHFAGTGGGMRILRAEPGRAVESILGKAAVDANPFLKGMSAGDVMAWANRKMGGKAADVPVVARTEFADDAAGDADWAAAQAEVERTELAAIEARRGGVIDDVDDDIPLDLDDVRAATRDAEPVGMDWEPAPSRWAEAVETLRRDQGGEVAGALYHPEVGAIDVKWGEAGTGKSDGYGLAKIVAHHAGVLEDLPERLAEMEIVSQTANRIKLESATHDASVRLDWDGKAQKWLMTAYEREAPAASVYARDAADGGASPRLGEAGDIADPVDAANGVSNRAALRDELGLSDDLADRVVGRRGDVLTIEDHTGSRFEWNASSEMQRVGKGWRALRADEIENELFAQRRALDEEMWAAIGDSPDILDDPTVAARLDDSMAHDAAMWLEEDPDLVVQLADPDSGAPEIRLADAIRDADDTLVAVEAARACMVPPGGVV